MPQRGDKLYAVYNGKLETVTFKAESIAEGATVATYELRGKDWLEPGFRCPTDLYLPTPKAAWERYLAERKRAHYDQCDALRQAEDALERIRDQICDATAEIQKCEEAEHAAVG